jgi:Uma2 family endonuclease
MYEPLGVETFPPVRAAIVYPDQDGNPMSDNTLQFEWIVKLKENLEILFAAVLDVFVAGDLLWYPVEGDNKTRQAPDVMVAMGRPKGYRGSYKQWQEGGVTPQVAFEILSPGNRLKEMAQKFEFYNRHGIEEYYLYNPYQNDLSVWLRQGPPQDSSLQSIPKVNGWVSPRLGIRFELTDQTMVVYGPDGQPFLSSVELAALREQERDRAEQERARADQAQSRAQTAETQLRQVVVNLGRSGLTAEQIATATGLDLSQIQDIQAVGG